MASIATIKKARKRQKALWVVENDVEDTILIGEKRRISNERRGVFATETRPMKLPFDDNNSFTCYCLCKKKKVILLRELMLLLLSFFHAAF